MGNKYIDEDEEIFDELDEIEEGDDENFDEEFEKEAPKPKVVKAPKHKVNQKIQLDGKFFLKGTTLQFKDLSGKVYTLSNPESELGKYRAIVYHEVQVTAVIDDESKAEPILKVMNYI